MTTTPEETQAAYVAAENALIERRRDIDAAQDAYEAARLELRKAEDALTRARWMSIPCPACLVAPGRRCKIGNHPDAAAVHTVRIKMALEATV